MLKPELIQQAKNLIDRAQNILVLPSSPPDGDSLGSAAALLLALTRLGKQITVVSEAEVPASLRFLPQMGAIQNKFSPIRDLIVTIDSRGAGVGNVRHEIQEGKVNIIITPQRGRLSAEHVKFEQGPPPYDLVLTVDAGDVSQFGSVYENNAELFQVVPVINIDHHISNTHFGKLNLVDVMASSASIVVMKLIESWGDNLIDADIATLLLAGLITDTGSFQNPNTNPDSFEFAAKLVDLGARQQEIIQHVYKTKELSTLKLWGKVLSKIQHDEAHRLVWSTISQEDLRATGAKHEASEGIIDELMTNAPGAEIVLLLKEKEPNVVGGSIRTLNPAIDASVLAGKFGGGGHAQAAGFTLQGISLGEAEAKVIGTMREVQKGDTQKAEPPLEVGGPVPQTVTRGAEIEAATQAATPLIVTPPQTIADIAPNVTGPSNPAQAFSGEKMIAEAKALDTPSFPAPLDMQQDRTSL